MSGPLPAPVVPVVITGFGVVSAYGLGLAELEAALLEGRPRLTPIDRSAGYHRADPSARLALQAGSQALMPWLQPGEARRMSPPSKLAVTAARQALAMAGLASPEGRVASEPAGEAADPAGATAVFLANSFGPSSFTEHLMRQILLENPQAASPFYFTECVANAPAAQIAIAARARGANVTVVQREAGPLLAVAKGAAEVASGRARRALVGAAEEMTPLLHSFLDRFGALSRGPRGSRGVDGEGEAARPFDRRRDGFLAAEGAVVWVLEREAEALARGARPLARVAGWASAFDPTAPPTDWGHGGAALARGLVRGLIRFGLAPAEIDRIVSGASGAVAGDRLEASVLSAAWEGLPLPPVLAPKGVTGEYGGGFLAAALLAACGAPFGPTAGFAQADPELGLVPHDGRPLPPPRRVLATGLAAGGAAAWLVLESMPGSRATE